MKKIPRRLIAQVSLRSLLITISLAILAFLLFFKLSSLVPGWSAAELAVRNNGFSLHHILSHPINAPYLVIVYGLVKVLPHSVLAVRLASALFGVGVILVFYFIIRCWSNPLVAWLTSLMLATSTWFLRSARTGTPDILLFGLLLLLAFNLWLRHSHRRRLIIVLVGLAIGLGLYVPGFIWFIAIVAVWQRRLIINVIRRLPIPLIVGAILGVAIILTPLAWAIAHNYQLVWAVLGLPSHLPALLPSLRRLIDVPLNIFVRGPHQPGLWVGRSPILDVFETILFIFGIYAHWQNKRYRRLITFSVVALVTTVLMTIGGPVSLSLLLPFIYFVMAAGLAYLLEEWFSTFPRNPIARGLGMTIVALAIGLSCFYQLNRYYIAWPHMAETKATFSHHLN